MAGDGATEHSRSPAPLDAARATTEVVVGGRRVAVGDRPPGVTTHGIVVRRVAMAVGQLPTSYGAPQGLRLGVSQLP